MCFVPNINTHKNIGMYEVYSGYVYTNIYMYYIFQITTNREQKVVHKRISFKSKNNQDFYRRFFLHPGGEKVYSQKKEKGTNKC